MASPPDRRRNPWRDGLAAETLRGRVDAPAFTAGRPARVIVPVADVRRCPDAAAELDTQALLGAQLTVYDARDGWAWVQLDRDRYVGYMTTLSLADGPSAPTHRVSSLASFVFPIPDMKRPPLMRLTLGAEVTVVEPAAGFYRLDSGGYVSAQHLSPLDRHSDDAVAVAERLIGTPYLWGGRTPLGCDCSGLVQLSFEEAGIAAPRDSDMQAAELGQPLAVGAEWSALRRGDLVCWRGHVGMMRDAVTLLHANAHHMAVASEPLAAAIARIATTAGQPTTVRRLMP